MGSIMSFTHKSISNHLKVHFYLYYPINQPTNSPPPLTTMKLTNPTSTSITILFTTLLSLPFAAADPNCPSMCVHNGDAGRWIDSHSPFSEVDNLVETNGGCYTATVQGKMCVTITGTEDDNVATVKGCLRDMAADWQSYHSDWFLWTAITCSLGDSVGTIVIT